MKTPKDQRAREAALDPRRSLIVQAPAGSGKTELLTRRFLVLLAHIEQPEQVVAITFTRKAAAEMRHRILEALLSAQGAEPEKSHERELWQLARAALAQDEGQGWALLRNPRRLRVQTIDSLCGSLARRLPVLSRLGGAPELDEDPRELFCEAARRTIDALEGDAERPIVGAVSTLYEHLDGNLSGLERLLVAQLRRRDQWMPVILSSGEGQQLRDDVEGALKQVIEDHLAALLDATPETVKRRLPALARKAAANLKKEQPDHAIVELEQLDALPGALAGVGADDLPSWRALSTLLLTNAGGLRKTINVKLGFPAKTPEKVEMAELLASLDEEALFVRLLARSRELPAARYSDAQWRVLEALIVLLKQAAAELKLVFAEAGQVDFIEIAQAAQLALGDESAPTDLALALDEQVRHLLVDEYQDTSFSQLALLQRLIAGWEPDDGRTLFLVGDPMQSIYRFREAEVGLFLRARESGVGDLRLEALKLEANFRSQGHLVAWVNSAFPRVLPLRDDVEVGAVSYSASSAFRDATLDPAVTVYPRLEDDRRAEAEQIAALIGDRINQEGSDAPRIAVLARGRAHLAEIAEELTRRGVAFQALEVEALNSRPVVSDLFALTRALLDPADRLAWLSILRAPFCGLTLADLLAVAKAAERSTIWGYVGEPSLEDSPSPPLSEAGRAGVERLRAAIGPALAQRRRVDLRRCVESVWLALGGRAAGGDEAHGEAETFLRLLEQHAHGRALVDLPALEEAVQQLYAPPDARADGRVQLMTMHKAKGLEFDVVILPGLGRRPRGDDQMLLRAMRRSLAGGESALLLAPIREAGEEQEPIYDHLTQRERDKSRYEAGRLLYVACTRAKKELHLFGHAPVRRAAKGKPLPHSESLLKHLWPVVKAEFEALPAPEEESAQTASEGTDAPPSVVLRRLKTDWCAAQLPEAPISSPPLETSPLGADAEPQITFEWASPVAAPVGTVVHRYLERFAEAGIAAWDHERVAALESGIEANLRSLGLGAEELVVGKRRVLRALHNVVDDERARWILDPAHQEARSELALTARLDDELVNVIVDRTFVEGGIRWIIDYKTGGHEGGDLEHFLDDEQRRYGAQLERYGRIFALRGDRRIRLALYFPLMAKWRAWDYTSS